MRIASCIFLLSGMFVLICACDKAEKNIHSLSGVYIVEKIEREFYVGGVVDSTVTDEKPGELCLYDNASEVFNNIINTMGYEPAAWGANGVGGAAAVGWYSNVYGKINSVTFFSEGSFTVPFATYTIPKFSPRGKMEWIYVSQGANGEIAWVETITVRHKK